MRYMGAIAPGGWHGYTPRHKSEGYVELFAFTREYVERLREGDPSTEQHFVTYFDQLLRIKLRATYARVGNRRRPPPGDLYKSAGYPA